MEQRLIDADALKEMICSHVYPVADYFNSKDYGMFWTGGIEKIIDEQPTIDAVPVIRCKDCTNYQPIYIGEDSDAMHRCWKGIIEYPLEYDYCSRAEGKEE